MSGGGGRALAVGAAESDEVGVSRLCDLMTSERVGSLIVLRFVFFFGGAFCLRFRPESKSWPLWLASVGESAARDTVLDEKRRADDRMGAAFWLARNRVAR